jgi:undecaprenyl-diphosphatase
MNVSTMLRDLDVTTFHALYGAGRPSTLTAVMIVLTLIGSGWTMLLLLPFLAARSTRPTAGALTLTLVATAVAVLVLKHAVRRIRPCNCLPDVHVLWSVAPKDFSFPSGHTTGAFAFAAFVVIFGRSRRSAAAHVVASVGALLYALGVGVSRVYLGFHFPSDVLGGAIVGIAVGASGARFFTRPAMAARLSKILLPS